MKSAEKGNVGRNTRWKSQVLIATFLAIYVHYAVKTVEEDLNFILKFF